jgi:FixJ family two-component response regulator
MHARIWLATVTLEKGMDACSATIFVVDDEEGVRRALERLLVANGFEVRAFESGHHFLLEHDATIPGCILLDLALPGMSGLQVQDALRDAGIDRPIIFVTGHADVPSSVRALKRGAVDFISKPIGEPELLDAITAALARDGELRAKRNAIAQVQQRVSRLTPREHEVFVRVVAGRLNKQIAGELGTQERTIKVHRARVMRKMGARTLADLVHLASRVGLGESDRTAGSSTLVHHAVRYQQKTLPAQESHR